MAGRAGSLPRGCQPAPGLPHAPPGATAPASVHHHFRGLHAFLSFLYREGLLSPNPIAQIRAPKLGEHFPEVFSEEEVHRLLAAPDRRTFEGLRNYAMVLTFLDTGVHTLSLQRGGSTGPFVAGGWP